VARDEKREGAGATEGKEAPTAEEAEAGEDILVVEVPTDGAVEAATGAADAAEAGEDTAVDMIETANVIGTEDPSQWKRARK
jgi:uncharacterized protein YuzE